MFPNPYRVEASWDRGTLVRDHYLWFANLPVAMHHPDLHAVRGPRVRDVLRRLDLRRRQRARNLRSGDATRTWPRRRSPGTTFGWNMITQKGEAAATGLYLYSVEPKGGGKRIGRQVPDRQVGSGELLMRRTATSHRAAGGVHRRDPRLLAVAACSPKKMMVPNLAPETTLFVQVPTDTVSHGPTTSSTCTGSAPIPTARSEASSGASSTPAPPPTPCGGSPPRLTRSSRCSRTPPGSRCASRCGRSTTRARRSHARPPGPVRPDEPRSDRRPGVSAGTARQHVSRR